MCCKNNVSLWSEASAELLDFNDFHRDAIGHLSKNEAGATKTSHVLATETANVRPAKYYFAVPIAADVRRQILLPFLAMATCSRQEPVALPVLPASRLVGVEPPSKPFPHCRFGPQVAPQPCSQILYSGANAGTAYCRLLPCANGPVPTNYSRHKKTTFLGLVFDQALLAWLAEEPGGRKAVDMPVTASGLFIFNSVAPKRDFL